VFENGNIQSRPLPELYQKTELSIRTWNVPASINTSLSEVDYELVVVNAQETTTDLATLEAGLSSLDYMSTTYEGGEKAETASLLAGLSTAENKLVVLSYSFGDSIEEITQLNAGLSSVEYDLIIFGSTVAPVLQTNLSTSLNSVNYETP
jgi:hypothetical protein